MCEEPWGRLVCLAWARSTLQSGLGHGHARGKSAMAWHVLRPQRRSVSPIEGLLLRQGPQTIDRLVDGVSDRLTPRRQLPRSVG